MQLPAWPCRALRCENWTNFLVVVIPQSRPLRLRPRLHFSLPGLPVPTVLGTYIYQERISCNDVVHYCHGRILLAAHPRPPRSHTRSVDRLSFSTRNMHLSTLLSTTSLFALGVRAQVLGPAIGDSAAAAVGTPVKRRHNFGARFACSAARSLELVGCSTVGHYYTACVLVVEFKYNRCRQRASNDISNTSEEGHSCPDSCQPAFEACAKICVSSHPPPSLPYSTTSNPCANVHMQIGCWYGIGKSEVVLWGLCKLPPTWL